MYCIVNSVWKNICINRTIIEMLTYSECLNVDQELYEWKQPTWKDKNNNIIYCSYT